MATQYREFTDPVTGDVWREGVRAAEFVVDIELDHSPGFDGVENVNWENIETQS